MFVLASHDHRVRQTLRGYRLLPRYQVHRGYVGQGKNRRVFFTTLKMQCRLFEYCLFSFYHCFLSIIIFSMFVSCFVSDCGQSRKRPVTFVLEQVDFTSRQCSRRHRGQRGSSPHRPATPCPSAHQPCRGQQSDNGNRSEPREHKTKPGNSYFNETK